VVVEYGGTTDRGVYFARPPIPGFPDSPAIFTFSEPEDARFWFPCHDVPDDKATADVFVTVPDGYLGASNGRLVEEAAAGPGRSVFHWRENRPHRHLPDLRRGRSLCRHPR